jgi:hypothetical protein
MLASNPHVFVHDIVIWTVPLVLCAAALRDRGSDGVGFTRFALLWPLMFAAGGFFDVKSAPLTLIDPRIWALAAGSCLIAACWLSARPTADAHDRRELGRAACATAAAQ